MIPIKQEPINNGLLDESSTATSSSLSLPSLIKVSPLKSLLRDDLRRKLSNSSSSEKNNNKNNKNNISINNKNNNDIGNVGKLTNENLICNNPHLRSEPPTSSRPDPRNNNNLQCSHCKITFPDQTLYFLHKGCHSESNPWKCNICGEQCCNLYQFNSHLLSKSHQ